jgi:hypothetical protein
MNYIFTQENDVYPVINMNYNSEYVQNIKYNLMNHRPIQQLTLQGKLKTENINNIKQITIKKFY